jgi:hypothetical protein
MATTEQIKANAKLIYAALPDARFSKATVLALAKCLDERLTWDEIPPEVKLCVIRLAMALDTEEEISRIQTDGAATPPPAATAEPTPPTPIKPDAVLQPDAAAAPPAPPAVEIVEKKAGRKGAA